MCLLISTLLISIAIAISPALSAPEVCPVVDATEGILLGGTVDGRWTEDSQIARLMKGGENYELYTLTKHIGKGNGTKPKEAETSGFLLRVSPLSKTSEHVIGVTGKWNPMPRVPKVQSTHQSAYLAIVRDFLQRKGIKNPNVSITQLIRVDLEGDGTDEVLIAATVPRKGYGTGQLMRAHPGDYSVVLMRKVIRGRAQTLCLDCQVHVKPDAGTIVDKFYIPAVLDFNGDGIMEIAVGRMYYEGRGVNIYSSTKPVIGGGTGA